MEVLKVFPTELYVFRNNFDNASLVQTLDTLDNIEIKKTTTISLLVNLQEHPAFKELFKWFEDCLEEIRVKEKYDCDAIKITNSWVNVALPGYNMHQNYHRHSMSFYSAVYYLTEGSPTDFEDPVHDRNHAQIEVLRHDYEPWEMVKAEPGKLVIFPSWMYHRSYVHTGPEKRYIISFNSLPCGKVNYNLATDSRVNLSIARDQKYD